MSTRPLENTRVITATALVRRDLHENGMSLAEYADSVMQGTRPFLNHDQFTYQFGSTAEDMFTVEDFFVKHNLTIVESRRDCATVIVSGTAEQFNVIFGIQLVEVTEPNRSYITHSGNINIPQHLQDVIQEVLGLDNSIDVTPSLIKPNPSYVSDPNSVHLTPQQMTAAYNFPDATGADVCVGIIQFGGGYTEQNLIDSFGINELSIPTIVPYSAGSTNNPGNNTESGEVVLDSLMVGGAAPDAKQVVYFGSGTSIQGWVNVFNAAVNDTVNNPSVLSVSWATSEALYWVRNVDTILQSAIAKGITIVAASGDLGTKGPSSLSINPTVCYPAASPYVLAVGGTTLQLDPDNKIANEYAWNQGNYSSGSGISSIYVAPSWQKRITAQQYPSGSVVGVPRRAIPDVAANADPATGALFYYGLSNYAGHTGGTSAAAPLWAGLIARIVELVGSNIGLLQPILYANSNTLNDITQGNNALPSIGVPTGYSATPGWDAVTGLGSPNGQAIYNLFVNNSEIKIKVDAETWRSVQNIQVKTDANTWTPVTNAWVKVDSETWKQVY